MPEFRVYIAGPMTGLPNHNREAFALAWNMLTQAGYQAVSPHFLESVIEIDTRSKISKEAVYKYALPIDIFAVSGCDAVVVLPGWQQSKGVGLELHAADLMGIPVYDGNHEEEEEVASVKQCMETAIRLIEADRNGSYIPLLSISGTPSER